MLLQVISAHSTTDREYFCLHTCQWILLQHTIIRKIVPLNIYKEKTSFQKVKFRFTQYTEHFDKVNIIIQTTRLEKKHMFKQNMFYSEKHQVHYS